MSTSSLLRFSRILLLLLLLCWAVFIVWLSLIPHPEKVVGFKVWDKVSHVVAYAVLALLMAQVLLRYDLFRRHAWCWTSVAAWSFGLLIEISQGLLTRSRKASFADLVANTCGILVAYLVGSLLTRVVGRWSREGNHDGA